ncbi:TetR/AcrR family transcriptional regulator [Nocardioides sp. SYSU D00038]|uniref:TetR/AcrR family transcriptional regulator n=1 Tax=Nocardioides sp. SYSU D00038 TaxID=2812554 RepID=UPI0019689AD6|nr:TetR/AcrR family transcriptional regulator [Nocardioides sp. SYSU D00038]
MPAKVDHEARRRDVAAAVWRVLASTGFAGLGLRAVAAELGATTGLITHYFPSKRELVRHALDQLHERSDQALGGEPDGTGVAALRAQLRTVLPTTEEKVVLSRIWVGFWDLALVDPELSAHEAERYARWKRRLRPHVEHAIAAGELRAVDVDVVLDLVTAATHGLVVQALLDPGRFPVGRQHAAVDLLLAGLAGPETRSTPRAPGGRVGDDPARTILEETP